MLNKIKTYRFGILLTAIVISATVAYGYYQYDEHKSQELSRSHSAVHYDPLMDYLKNTGSKHE